MTFSKAVRIQPLTYSDLSDLHTAAINSRGLHEPWFSAPQTIESWHDFIRRRLGPQDLGFVVRRTSDAALVGFFDITNIVRGVFQSGYLSYFAVSGYEGQGFMSSGLKQLVGHAFTELGLHRLEANIRPENAKSISLVKRTGFSREGYSPRYLKLGGVWRDHERWAILAEE
jgi:ribosomal-protein-alanine N-acetyltransferase